MELPQLAIPEQVVRLRRKDNGMAEVWDIWSQRWIGLNPEEWVRQQFLHWLVAGFNYPSGRIQVEKKVNGLGKARRFDALVLAKDGSPFMLIEFKSPEVKLNKEVFFQIAHYNKQISAQYLTLSNGLQTYIAAIESNSEAVKFCTEIPRLSDV